MSQVQDFNLFPETNVLLVLERKYGDSLNYVDLHGAKQRRKKKRHAGPTDSIQGTTVDGQSKYTATVGATSEKRSEMTKTDIASVLSPSGTEITRSVHHTVVD